MNSIWLPIIVTICALFAAATKQPEGGTYGAGHVIGCGMFMLATIVALAAWLIWALVA